MVTGGSRWRCASRAPSWHAPQRRLETIAVFAAVIMLAIAPTAAALPQPRCSHNGEPLSALQWYLAWNERGTRPTDGAGVSLGVIDTGIDSSHPELANAYNPDDSRSFLPPDACGAQSDCTDPGTDPVGHGTGVAGVIASAWDGQGIGGAASGVDLVSLRAGDPTGTFTANAVAQAIRYSADAGLDVVVMAFTVDPWFRYCDNAPGDTAQERAQQATERAQVEAALDYAEDNGVILIAAAGNESFDLDRGTADQFSAAWAGRGTRTVTDQCVTLPAQSDAVITVGATTPTGERAAYSNTGADIDIVAPGGNSIWYDTSGTIHGQEEAVLTTVPAEFLRDAGLLSDNGEANLPEVVAECSQGPGTCRYYRYVTGTSYAAPQVAAAAAVLLSRGTPAHRVHDRLMTLAVPIDCPEPDGQSPSCENTENGNTWYGAGSLRLSRPSGRS